MFFSVTMAALSTLNLPLIRPHNIIPKASPSTPSNAMCNVKRGIPLDWVLQGGVYTALAALTGLISVQIAAKGSVILARADRAAVVGDLNH